jgi:multidrug efflux pump subunit AcrA (membrane-fusion protein)
VKFKLFNLAALAVVAVTLIAAAGCSSKSAASTSKTQLATVQKGDVTIEVIGTGNLALQTKQDLAFEMSGTVSEVLVNLSDSVKKGQQLATLDTSDYDGQLKTLQKNVTAAERGLTNAGRAVDTAQQGVNTAQENVIKAQRQIPAKELAVQQAELDLQTAQNNLANLADIKKAQAVVDAAQADLDNATSSLQQAAIIGNSALIQNLNTVIPVLKTNLAQAQDALKALLSGATASDDLILQMAKAQLGISQAQNNLVAAQDALSDAKQAVADAQAAVGNAQLAVADAQTGQSDAADSLQDAQTALTEAQALSPVITAPMDGIVTKIDVSGGQAVQKGTVALQIADPTQFSADILVTEQDVFSVQVGADATVSLDALSGITFPAKVTAVAPTASVSQGVVNYSVTVKLTQVQAVPNPATTTSLTTNLSQASNQDISLKDGLSATVNILVQSKKDVLVVPNRAITRQGQTATVQVVSGATTQTRTVTTGLSDSTNTEIVDGLSAGEQVLIRSTTTSTTTSNVNSGPGPGIGGIPLP